MMTVRQLREALSDFDQNAVVAFFDSEWGSAAVEDLTFYEHETVAVPLMEGTDLLWSDVGPCVVLS